MSRELRVGNFYLKRLTSYERIKADTDYSFGVTYDYRVRMALMAFLGLEYPALRDGYVLVPGADAPGRDRVAHGDRFAP